MSNKTITIMKKLNYLVSGLLVAMFAIAVSSCQKSDDVLDNKLPVLQAESDDDLVYMEFSASTSGSKTRSVLTENNAVSWNIGDKVTIFDGVAGREFTTSSNGQFATFSGRAKRAAAYCALYPYQPDAVYDNGIIRNVTLSATQTAVAGTFSNNISVAYSSDMNLYFRNVVSLVKISVNSDEASEICKITLNTSAPLAGSMDIAIGNDNIPYVNNIQQESSSVTLELAEGFTNGVDYYMAVIPTNVTEDVREQVRSGDYEDIFRRCEYGTLGHL